MNTKNTATSLDSLLAAASHYNDARAAYEACMTSNAPASITEAACADLLEAKQPFADGTDSPPALGYLDGLVDELALSRADAETRAAALLGVAQLAIAAYTISAADNEFLAFALMQHDSEAED